MGSGTVRGTRRGSGRRAQWQFRTSSEPPTHRPPPSVQSNSALGDLSEKRAGIWDAIQRSFDGCWTFTLVMSQE